MKVKKENKRAFTIIELLCIIVILGVLSAIAIVGSYNLINRANSVHKDQQENTVIMATKSYIQKDNSIAPKIVGESKNIKIQTLRDNNYLKEDIKDNNGKSCMKDSYVRVYKIGNTEYTYIAYIYCGDDKVPEVEEIPTPKIEVYYTDLNNNKLDDNKTNSFDEVKFNIKINGGVTKGGNSLELNTYSYTISILNNQKDYIEVFNSKDINANRKTNITISEKLKEYLDNEKLSSIKINVTATNTIGGILELTSYLQNN